MSADTIEAVEAVAVTRRLPTPIRLGANEIPTREYALVRVTTSAGLVGAAYCLTRGAPVVESVERCIAPVLVGKDADTIAARWDDGYRATIMAGRSGVLQRALGLADIALWDIKGQRAGMPLWRLLGGHRPDVRCLLVAGYPVTGGSLEALADDLVAYAARGNRLLKIARLEDRDAMATLLGDVAARAGADIGLIVDAAYCWSSVGEAHAESSAWGVPLTWLEDPFPPERLAAYRRFREFCPYPLAAGDEASAPATAALLDARLLDYLRLDVPAVGGITPALQLLARAAAAEVPVSFHVYPEVSVHLAAAVAPGVARRDVRHDDPRREPVRSGAPRRRLVARARRRPPRRARAARARDLARLAGVVSRSGRRR